MSTTPGKRLSKTCRQTTDEHSCDIRGRIVLVDSKTPGRQVIRSSERVGAILERWNYHGLGAVPRPPGVELLDHIGSDPAALADLQAATVAQARISAFSSPWLARGWRALDGERLAALTLRAYPNRSSRAVSKFLPSLAHSSSS